MILLEVCERPGARDRGREQGTAPAQTHPQRPSQVGEYEVDAQGIAAWTRHPVIATVRTKSQQRSFL